MLAARLLDGASSSRQHAPASVALDQGCERCAELLCTPRLTRYILGSEELELDGADPMVVRRGRGRSRPPGNKFLVGASRLELVVVQLNRVARHLEAVYVLRTGTPAATPDTVEENRGELHLSTIDVQVQGNVLVGVVGDANPVARAFSEANTSAVLGERFLSHSGARHHVDLDALRKIMPVHPSPALEFVQRFGPYFCSVGVILTRPGRNCVDGLGSLA